MLLTADPLWQLTAACADDARPERLDLIVGVYRDDSGASPVMRAVRAAELRLAQRSTSKEYAGPSGNRRFAALLTDLMLGDPALTSRTVAVQSVAGTGALRLIAELLATTGPDRTVHLGTPSYVNHAGILAAAGLRVATHPVRDMLAAVETARPGDALVIQGCCHNPSGFSMPIRQWDELSAALVRRGVVPFIDQAYFGLGDGLDADLAGMRRLLRAVGFGVVAVSGSKAWGLYSERVGAALVVGDLPGVRSELEGVRGEVPGVRGLLEGFARTSYSQPPAHGAMIVEEILGDPELTACWRSELEAMRRRLGRLRTGLASHLDMPDLAEQRGMFLSLPLTADAMERLRVDHGIYGLPSGRINLAGLPESRIPQVAEAIRLALAAE